MILPLVKYLEAHGVQIFCGVERRLAVFNHVGEQRSFYKCRCVFYLRLILQGLYENHIGAGFPVGNGPVNGVFIAVDGNGIGPGNDHGIGVLSGMDGGANFGDHFFFCDDLLAFHMAAAFGHDLVFQLDAGNTGHFVFRDGADDIQSVAVAIVSVGDNGNFGTGADIFGGFCHFLHGNQANIWTAQYTGGDAVAGHIHCGKTGFFNQPCRPSIIGTRSHDNLASIQQFSEFLRFCHNVSLRNHLIF